MGRVKNHKTFFNGVGVMLCRWPLQRMMRLQKSTNWPNNQYRQILQLRHSMEDTLWSLTDIYKSFWLVLSRKDKLRIDYVTR